MNVWSYWSGPIPDWISICIESFNRCCKLSKFTLLTPDTAHGLVGGDLYSRRWLGIRPGIGTDCLRAAILAKHGGLWVDADTVCLRDPIHLITKRHLPTQFLYSRWTSEKAIAGYVYSPAGNPIAMQWLDRVNSALKYADVIGWGHLGEDALTPIIDGCMSSDLSWQIPLDTFIPLDFDQCPEALFSTLDWRKLITGNTIAFGLNNSWMTDRPWPSGCLADRLIQFAKEENDAK